MYRNLFLFLRNLRQSQSPASYIYKTLKARDGGWPTAPGRPPWTQGGWVPGAFQLTKCSRLHPGRRVGGCRSGRGRWEPRKLGKVCRFTALGAQKAITVHTLYHHCKTYCLHFVLRFTALGALRAITVPILHHQCKTLSFLLHACAHCL